MPHILNGVSHWSITAVCLELTQLPAMQVPVILEMSISRLLKRIATLVATSRAIVTALSVTSLFMADFKMSLPSVLHPVSIRYFVSAICWLFIALDPIQV